ncbi:beta-crystallin B2-like [Mizuhopecten yessoensis]|uniref:beta-crystallin B2-like n=1 Tax=Mizuhopecten yessoensis TaxID=6573 RepID=UPI000B4583BB|nr:beta-crystallin B2-like [Mizuhopecten yessoensis]
MALTGFDDKIVSVDVKRGIWVLYEEVNFGGNIYVVWEGQKINLPMTTTSSLKPIEGDFSDNPSLTVYNGPSFTGKNKTFNSSNSNLVATEFQDSITSVVVDSGTWVAYRDVDYQGPQYLFTRGAFNGTSSEGHFQNDKISSLKPITRCGC